MFVYHVPEMCLLGIDGTPPPTLALKLWLKNHVFTFFTSSLKLPKLPADGTSYNARKCYKPRPS